MTRRWLVLIFVCAMVFLFPFVLDRCHHSAAGETASVPNMSGLSQVSYLAQSAQGRTTPFWNRRRPTSRPAQHCTFSISPTGETVDPEGVRGSIVVTPSAPVCKWAVTETLDWISIHSGAEGVGTGIVTYAVSSNNSSFMRVGSITVAGQTFTVVQKSR